MRMFQVDPRHPVAAALKNNARWSYFHTHRVDDALVARAVEHNRSIEFDIYARDGRATIQHPPAFYVENGAAPPANMDLEDAIAAVEASAACVVVLDAKSREALGVIAELVARLGTHRCVVHAFLDELRFDPPPAGARPRAHWVDEDLPLDEVVRAAAPAGGPHRAALFVTCRHVTPDRLGDAAAFGVLERIEAKLAGAVDAVGFWLPGGVAPPAAVAARLLRSGLLVSFNADAEAAGAAALPAPCVCMTDVLDRATRHAAFSY